MVEAATATVDISDEQSYIPGLSQSILFPAKHGSINL